MTQRLVFLNLPLALIPEDEGQMTFIDLDPERLAKDHPKLAEQLRGRRVVSHTVHTWLAPQETIVSLVTEPDERSTGH